MVFWRVGRWRVLRMGRDAWVVGIGWSGFRRWAILRVWLESCSCRRRRWVWWLRFWLGLWLLGLDTKTFGADFQQQLFDENRRSCWFSGRHGQAGPPRPAAHCCTSCNHRNERPPFNLFDRLASYDTSAFSRHSIDWSHTSPSHGHVILTSCLDGRAPPIMGLQEDGSQIPQETIFCRHCGYQGSIMAHDLWCQPLSNLQRRCRHAPHLRTGHQQQQLVWMGRTKCEFGQSQSGEGDYARPPRKTTDHGDYGDCEGGCEGEDEVGGDNWEAYVMIWMNGLLLREIRYLGN